MRLTKNSTLPHYLFLILTFSFSPVILAEIDSVQNKPPSLITDPLIPATAEMLKSGLWGSTSVEVSIDSTGQITSCNITPSVNPGFDSLVKCKVALAKFTPAIENNHAVQATVNFEISVPYDSLVSQCMRFPSNLFGTVFDTSLKIPLPGTRILLQYTDTTEDSAITIGFDRYISTIGKCERQKSDEKKLLITETDSLGRFSFRLLPAGHYTLSVQSAGYEVGHFKGCITKDKISQTQLILRPSETNSKDSSFAITVYGRPEFTENKIIIGEEEKHIGFSPFLSNIIQSKAGIRRVPEGPSKMIVRSGCPYDNQYVIAGVPLLAPFHFGGHPYADIDGLMISALSSVNVTIDDIAAKRIDASGCLIKADPGLVSYDGSPARGFYLKGDFSMIGVDLMTAYSSKKKDGDYLQIGFSKSDDYYLKVNNLSYSSVDRGNYGIGIPAGYGNATLSGSKSIGKFRCSAFGWFAWDSYNFDEGNSEIAKQSDQSFFPWGMGSYRIASNRTNRSFTIGGAHQFFGTGRQNRDNIISTRSFLSNGEMTFDFDTIIRKPFVAKLTTRIDHNDWRGYLIDQDNIKSLDTVLRLHGKETSANLNSSLIKQIANVTIELELLASAISYSGANQVIGDAGTSVTYTGDNYQAGFHFGRVSSRPDIRGLPDSVFRRQLNHTYIASIPVALSYRFINKVGITPYIRYSTNAPQLDPVKQVWNPHGSTPVRAFGTDIDFRVTPFSWAELSAALNLANTRRLSDNDEFLPYEWDLPWTIRTGLHLKTRNDLFHFFLDYIHSKGLPYYDFDIQEYATLPIYRSFDINLQFYTKMPRQRFINLLACYATVKNVEDLLGTTNVRDYYWDRKGIRQSIFLGNGRMDIGMRFGIKL